MTHACSTKNTKIPNSGDRDGNDEREPHARAERVPICYDNKRLREIRSNSPRCFCEPEPAKQRTDKKPYWNERRANELHR